MEGVEVGEGGDEGKNREDRFSHLVLQNRELHGEAPGAALGQEEMRLQWSLCPALQLVEEGPILISSVSQLPCRIAPEERIPWPTNI